MLVLLLRRNVGAAQPQAAYVAEWQLKLCHHLVCYLQAQ